MSHRFIEDYPGGGRSEHLDNNAHTTLYVEHSSCRCGSCRRRLKDTDIASATCPDTDCGVTWQRIVLGKDRNRMPQSLPDLPVVSEAVIRPSANYPPPKQMLGKRSIEIVQLLENRYL